MKAKIKEAVVVKITKWIVIIPPFCEIDLIPNTEAEGEILAKLKKNNIVINFWINKTNIL